MPDLTRPSPLTATHTLTVQVGTFGELAYQHIALTPEQKDALTFTTTVHIDETRTAEDINVAAQNHLRCLIAPHMGFRFGLDVAFDWLRGIGQVLLTPALDMPRQAASITVTAVAT